MSLHPDYGESEREFARRTRRESSCKVCGYARAKSCRECGAGERLCDECRVGRECADCAEVEAEIEAWRLYAVLAGGGM